MEEMEIGYKVLAQLMGETVNGDNTNHECDTNRSSRGLVLAGGSVNGGNGGQDFGNGGNGGFAINGGSANVQDGTNSSNGGSGGLVLGPGSEANGANGQNGGIAVGAGSNANGGGAALNGGNTNDISGGIALNGGQDHQGCNVAIGSVVEFQVSGK